MIVGSHAAVPALLGAVQGCHRVALVALGFIVLEILLAILAPWIVKLFGHPPNAQFPDELDPTYGTPTGPSREFLFGVDPVGRDVFARVVYGARVSLQVALIATFLSVGLGVVAGLLAGFHRGATDTVISRVIDVTLAFPILLLALGIASSCSLGNGCARGVIKPGLSTVIVAIVVVNWTYIGRIMRGQVLSLREKEFVEAALASRCREHLTILFRELLPNLVAPIVVYSTLVIPQNILLEAALSYLGVSIQPPTGELGRNARRSDADLLDRLVVLRLPRASRSCSPSSRSTSSATGSATPSIRKPHDQLRRSKEERCQHSHGPAVTGASAAAASP